MKELLSWSNRTAPGVILGLLLGLLCIVLSNACTITSPTTVNVTNATTVNVVTTLNLSPPVDSLKAGCAAIAKIQVDRPEVLAVGASAALMATPRDSADNKRSPDCDEADGITWSPNPTDVASVENPKAFVTSIRGTRTGNLSLGVSVGKATSSVSIQVK